MSKVESAAVPAAPIPRSALVAGSGGCQLELTRDLREIAANAAREWAHANAVANPLGAPAEFGTKVAQVYLAALRELNAGFGPEQQVPRHG